MAFEFKTFGGTMTAPSSTAPAGKPATKPGAFDFATFTDKPAMQAETDGAGIFSKVGKYVSSVGSRALEGFDQDVSSFKTAFKGATDTSSPVIDRVANLGSTVKAGTVGPISSALNTTLIPVSDAIQYFVEKSADHISDIPAVQRIAASDAVDNILKTVGKGSITLDEAAKKYPQIAKDVGDLTNMVLLLAGNNAKPTIKRAAGIPEGNATGLGVIKGDSSNAINNWLSSSKMMFDAAAEHPEVFADRSPAQSFIHNAVMQLEAKNAPKALVSALEGIDVSTITSQSQLQEAVKAAIAGFTGPASEIVAGAQAVGGAVKGAVEGAGRAITAPARAVRSILEIKPADMGKPGVADTFKKYGIEPPVSAITDSGAVRGTEAYLQGSSFLGGPEITKIVDTARTGIADIVEKMRRNVQPAAMKTEGISPSSVGDELKTSFSKLLEKFNAVKNDLYTKAEAQIGSQNAILNNTRAAIQEIVSQLEKSAVPTAQREARFFNNLMNNLSNAQKRTFSNVKATRSDIGKMLENAKRGLPVEGADVGRLKRVYGALSEDLEATIKQSGAEAVQALNLANAYYKEGLSQLNSLSGRLIRNSRSPELLVQKIIKPGEVTAVEDLKKLIGNNTFAKVSQLFMNNVLEAATLQLTGKLDPRRLIAFITKYGEETIKAVVGERGLNQLKELLKDLIANDILEAGTNAEGKILPGQLARAIDKYDEETLKKVFSPEELTKIKDVQEMASAIGKGTRLVEGSPTAEKLAPFAVNALVGAVNLPALLAKLGAEWGAAKLFTSPWGRRLLTGGKLGEPVKSSALSGAKESISYSERSVPQETGSKTPIADRIVKNVNEYLKDNPPGLTIRNVKRIPQDDLATMSDFTDYVAGSYRVTGKAAQDLELDATRLWERYLPDQKLPKTPQGIANGFGRILEEKGFKRRK